eukprot:455044-Karenia_brevis.AAC.1
MIPNGYDPEYICKLDEMTRTMSKYQPVELDNRSYMYGARWEQELAGTGVSSTNLKGKRKGAALFS